MVINIKKLRDNAIIPHRATGGSAGLDLSACIDRPVDMLPGERAIIPTGLAIGLPTPEVAAFIYARSGLAVKRGVTLSNCVGVVDSDYRGEICVGLINQSNVTYSIQPGERIAQMIIAPVILPEIMQVENLDQTDRGEGGFGSTGKL